MLNPHSDYIGAGFPSRLEKIIHPIIANYYAARIILPLIRRKPGTVLGLYASHIYGPKKANLALVLYSVFRYLDDGIDCEIDLENPDILVNGLKDQLATDTLDDSWPAFMLSYSHKRLGSTDEAKTNMIQLLGILTEDHERMQQGSVFTIDELVSYHERTGTPVTNLYLMAAGSNYRSKDLAQFSQVQERVQDLRDLEKEWEQGLFNVPEEVLKKAGVSTEDPYSKIQDNPIVKEWISNQLELSKQQLLQIPTELDNRLATKFVQYRIIKYRDLIDDIGEKWKILK